MRGYGFYEKMPCEGMSDARRDAFVTCGHRPTAATAHPLINVAIVGFVLWKNNACNNSALLPRFYCISRSFFIFYWS